MPSLPRRALTGHLQFLLALAALLFVGAGSITYWQGWLFLIMFSAASLAITFYLMKYDPALLERRLSGRLGAEKQDSQKKIQLIAFVLFLASLLLPALDHRFGWSYIPMRLTVIGDGLVGLGMLIVFFVFRANSYASALIELAGDQKVIDSGPYATIRHPMYAGALILMTGIPLALGSWWGLLLMPLFALVLIWRLQEEENFLVQNLPGYAAYQARVKFRLIPLLW